ncbi:unnamed protein product [Paramecium sonneborni]|uniref:Uncharacterized protein n=1 Tax=Paramecium sonneborni TaxID=65129 RepID=A0A8S1RQ73_9CILI|nr:unnamed protein product [Paramecium sonneborni]
MIFQSSQEVTIKELYKMNNFMINCKKKDGLLIINEDRCSIQKGAYQIYIEEMLAQIKDAQLVRKLVSKTQYQKIVKLRNCLQENDNDGQQVENNKHQMECILKKKSLQQMQRITKQKRKIIRKSHQKEDKYIMKKTDYMNISQNEDNTMQKEIKLYSQDDQKELIKMDIRYCQERIQNQVSSYKEVNVLIIMEQIINVHEPYKLKEKVLIKILEQGNRKED